MVIQGKVFAAPVLEYQLVFRGVEAGVEAKKEKKWSGLRDYCMELK